MFNTLHELVKPGDTVVDGRANIGAITVLLARRIGPSGRVIPVEMMPDMAARLRRNIALNGPTNVEVSSNSLKQSGAAAARCGAACSVATLAAALAS